MTEAEKSLGGDNILRHQVSEAWLKASALDDFPLEELHRQVLSDKLSDLFGMDYQVFHELIPDVPHVDVLLIEPVPENMPFRLLMTSGMSALPMTLPSERPGPLYAELMLGLPADWPIGEDAEEEDAARGFWPVGWLKQLAKFPHQYGTYLAPGHTLPNADPPEPLAPGVPFTGALIGESVFFSRTFTRLPVPGHEHLLNIFTVFPLTTAEMDYKLAHGTRNFIETIWGKLSDVVDIHRPSLI